MENRQKLSYYFWTTPCHLLWEGSWNTDYRETQVTYQTVKVFLVFADFCKAIVVKPTVGLAMYQIVIFTVNLRKKTEGNLKIVFTT